MADLPKWAKERKPSTNEDEFFKYSPHVTGYATDDHYIVMNPYSIINEQEKSAVRLNEATRLFLRAKKIKPQFALTPDQLTTFSEYSHDENDIKHTIAARILSGDPSVGIPTNEQMEFVKKLRKEMYETNTLEWEQ